MSDKIMKAANTLTIAVTLRLRHLLLTKKLDSSSASLDLLSFCLKTVQSGPLDMKFHLCMKGSKKTASDKIPREMNNVKN